MGRKGDNKMTKRSNAPSFWAINRKRYQFAVTTSPGPHRKSESYSLAVLVRDVLKLTKTYRETLSIIRNEKILVDGLVRRKPDFR